MIQPTSHSRPIEALWFDRPDRVLQTGCLRATVRACPLNAANGRPAREKPHRYFEPTAHQHCGNAGVTPPSTTSSIMARFQTIPSWALSRSG